MIILRQMRVYDKSTKDDLLHDFILQKDMINKQYDDNLVFIMIRNFILTFLKKNNREKARRESIGDIEYEYIDEVYDETHINELNDKVMCVLSQLDDEQTLLFRMYYLDKQSIRKIAKITNLSSSTIYNRLVELKLKIKKNK